MRQHTDNSAVIQKSPVRCGFTKLEIEPGSPTAEIDSGATTPVMYQSRLEGDSSHEVTIAPVSQIRRLQHLS
jgi:hypothetical protein